MSSQGDSPWAVLHSSKRHDWRTPPELFKRLDREFGFLMDAAASKDNALCEYHMSVKDDALTAHWADHMQPTLKKRRPMVASVFCNPPYGRGVGKWVQKAYEESKESLLTVVVLVFACTDTKWWRDWAWKADEIRFISGRLKFLNHEGKEEAAAPKGSAILVFRPYASGPPKCTLLTR